MGNLREYFRGLRIRDIINETNEIIAYKKVERPESVGCSIILLDRRGKIILGTRTDYPDGVLKKIIESGHELKWTNAGGGLENGESPVYCIIRELKEEFGIEAGKQTTHLEVVGYNNNYYLKNRWVKCRRDFIFIASLKDNVTMKNFIPQEGEIGEIKSFFKSEIMDMIIQDKIHKSTKNSILMAIKLGYL